MTVRIVFCVLLIFSLVAAALPAEAARQKKAKKNAQDPKKYAAVVIHEDTGMVLHKENADEVRYPASLVKMMTLYLTFDALKKGKISYNQYVRASRNAAAQPSLNIGMHQGEKIRIQDAIRAVAVRSANDAAVLLAETVAGNEKEFVDRMNRTAKHLGMTKTVFRNPSGLHHKQQVSTAKDMAKLTMALRRDFPKEYKLLSGGSFSRKGKKYQSHARLLKSYNGANGGKTGYINASGFNLSMSAARRGHNLVAVVMGGKSAELRDREMARLMDAGFASLGHNNRRDMRELAAVPSPKLKPWPDEDNLTQLVASTPPSRSAPVWSIELGAFNKEHDAITAVTTAMDAAPEQLAFSHINFVNRSIDGQLAHWAKFIKLTENQARQACARLSSSGTECRALPDVSSFMTAVTP